jgi:hypothetical protein
MSSNQQIPKKGDIVINPKTNRPIKVGGRSWLKAVKEGLITGTYRDPHELKDIKEGSTLIEMEREKDELNSKLPPTKQAVRGRGKHKGKFVIRDKGLNPVDVSKYTARVAAQAVQKNIGKLANAVNDDDISNMLEKMILEEMMVQNEPTQPINIPKPRFVRQTGYYKINKNEEGEDEYEALTEDEDDYEYED